MTEIEERIKKAVDAKFEDLREKYTFFSFSNSSTADLIFPSYCPEWLDGFINFASAIITDVEDTLYLDDGSFILPEPHEVFKILWLSECLKRDVVAPADEFNLYVNFSIFYDYSKELSLLINRLERIENTFKCVVCDSPAEYDDQIRCTHDYLNSIEELLEGNKEHKDTPFYIAAKEVVEQLKKSNNTESLKSLTIDMNKLGGKFSEKLSVKELAHELIQKTSEIKDINYSPFHFIKIETRTKFPNFKKSIEELRKSISNSITALKSIGRNRYPTESSIRFEKALFKAQLESVRCNAVKEFVDSIDANDNCIGERYRKSYWLEMRIDLNKQLRSAEDVNGDKFIRQNYTPFTKNRFCLLSLDSVKDIKFLYLICCMDIIDEIIKVIENAENGKYVSNSNFSISANRWVELYEAKIDSKLKGENLVKHVEKLRQRYLEAKADNKSRWITAFLRNTIFNPPTPWLNDINRFSQQAVEDLFDDKRFNKDAVSRAKKIK